MAKQNEKPKETTNDPIESNETVEECFIITPIGAFGSETFTKAMGLIDAVIDPVLVEKGMKAMPANRMQDLGSINKQLIKRVIEDRLVIANLTGLNPNVMYELAIRHGARKPVIIMAEEGTKLPFDITDQRTIFYSDTLSGVENAKDELRKKIEFALMDEDPDNPIYSYLENAKLFKEIGEADPNKALLTILNSINEKVSNNFDYQNTPSKIRNVNLHGGRKGNNNFRISGYLSDIDDPSELFAQTMQQMLRLAESIATVSGGIAHTGNGSFRFSVINTDRQTVEFLSNKLYINFPSIKDLRTEIIESR